MENRDAPAEGRSSAVKNGGELPGLAAASVDHPAHYTYGSIEVIDVIEGLKLPYHLGNAVKYIEFIVVNSGSPDDEERYTIDLTEEEQKILFACLDSQCKEHLEKSCEDLLDEAEKQMEEDYL